MTGRRAFSVAIEQLSLAHEHHDSLCNPFLAVVPVDGAVVSTFGAPFGAETLCASDPKAARFDELQFDLGEGPGWDAMRTGAPVAVHDIRSGAGLPWPALLNAVGGIGIRGVNAFPLMMGSLMIGAVGLYSWEPGTLTTPEQLDAGMLASVVAKQVLRRALDAQTVLPPEGIMSHIRDAWCTRRPAWFWRSAQSVGR
ncbi:GAF domain-containing protein [Cryobacterium sp. MLB-32]|uniref:GAF domain-containing protein n=1 Tax=Cryobacterium sp. MLB-32 TaxID=1529318 RepID=UPI00068DC354|nr:GAF domain-containing protein [Cryobacterium sp. MLB-32]